MYAKEIRAIKRAKRWRERRIFEDVKDFASNDYLGLSHQKELLQRAFEKVSRHESNSAKASQLISGYTPIHEEFEKQMAQASGFESALTVGSGFLANIALIEALVRKGDLLVLDEEFHASGILASKLVTDVAIFRHNDPQDLQKQLAKRRYKRAIIAVEGIYSMSGDLVDQEILQVAKEHILIIDEAHSVGVVGERLLGVLDRQDMQITPNIIKMGTMGKALGSYGAYILASKEIVSYLLNRAKPIIYSTALSLMDVALAHEGLEEIKKRASFFKKEIATRRKIAKEHGYDMQGLILDIPYPDVLGLQEALLQKGYLVGAIRPPTVKEPMVRIIARIGESGEDFAKLLELVSDV